MIMSLMMNKRKSNNEEKELKLKNKLKKIKI
jgi:hypothetical protein